MDFSARLETVMREAGTLLAVEFEDRTYAWAQIQALKISLDDLFADAQVRLHTAIAIVVRNRPSGLAAFLSILAGHRCATLVSPIQPTRALCEDMLRLRPAVLVADTQDWSQDLIQSCREIGAVAIEISEQAGEFRAAFRDGLTRIGAGAHYEAPHDASVVVPTSGTTGPPKRIALSWSHLDAHVPAEERALRQGRGVILANPLVTITGANIVFPCVTRPMLISLMERLDVRRWCDLVEKHAPKRAGLPPAAMRMILDASVPKQKLASLEAWVTGSAPLDPALAEEFEAAFDIPVLTSYGATEFGGAVARWTLEDRHFYGQIKRGASGKAADGVELRVAALDTGAILPPGEQGVLEVRSARAPVADPSAWIRTTDLGRIDADGFLFIDGRADDVIIRGGFKVPLGEVEAALKSHPGVLDAAAIGLPDARLGQTPAAAVVATGPPPSATELLDWLRERLAPYKVPVKIIFLDELPLNPSLKVSRPRLREMIDEASTD